MTTTIITLPRAFGFAVGALVGGGPFWLVVSPWGWPGVMRAGTAAAVVVSVLAGGTPAAWLLGLIAGVFASWGAFAVLVGSDWRLLPYVLLQSQPYYLIAAAGLGLGSTIALFRRQARVLS